MKILWIALGMTAASNLAHPAERVPVLAELFTSEGCNSCPPADALLRKLDREQPVSSAQIIVLSEHVDYWNYLGWRDPFSSPLFSRRQSDYTRMLGAENFTPQLVIDGREQVLGSDPAAAQAAIARAAARVKSTIRVEAKREGGQAVIAIVIEPRTRSDVWLAIADESARSSVTAGENARRTLDHVAVARSLSKIGAVKKSQPFEKTLRVPVNAGPSRVVIFLADPANPVQGAALALIP